MINKGNDCYNLAYNMPKLTIKEFIECLQNKDQSSCNRFIKGFMRYIYNSTYKIYMHYNNLFSASYDYEDFFEDGVILATEMYYKYDFYNTSKNSSFNNFCNRFRYLLLQKLSERTLGNVNEMVLLRLNNIKNKVDERASYHELKSLAKNNNLSLQILLKALDNVNIDDLDIFEDSFEKDVIDNFDFESLHDELIKALNLLTEKQKMIIEPLFGISSDGSYVTLKRQFEIADKLNTTRQNVNKNSKLALKKMRDFSPNLKNYL